MSGEFRTWEDYFIPGTQTLRNLYGGRYGISDPAKLERQELAETWSRIVGLAKRPVSGDFGLDHLLEVHRRIFQDVYAWAGQVRVGPVGRMTK